MKNDQFWEAIHYEHDVVYYVPVFLINPGEPISGSYIIDGSYPTLVHDMSMATTDPEMAWSFEPYYVLELRGHFNTTTPPWIHPDVYSGHGNGD
jgi:hypothetical protein